MSRDLLALAIAALTLSGCAQVRSRQVIVLGVDGMDPGFVEAHWNALPNLEKLKQDGVYSRLRTTTPPQSPVAWSTFATGLDPADHGIFDFVHRDAATQEPFLSTDRTEPPRFSIGLGPFEIPLSKSRVVSLRHGAPFWRTLSNQGVPVTIIRMPANYPPEPVGHALAGMGTPDLRGTSSTFTFYTDDPDEITREVSGGSIRKISPAGGHYETTLDGPPNTLRKDRRIAKANVRIDVDPSQPYALIHIGSSDAILREGEWSDWLGVGFALIPHVATAHGTVRVYLRRVRPHLELYISPVNDDPASPSLPISTPSGFSRALAEEAGHYYTVGIPEDTAALRQGIFDLGEFLAQTRLVLTDERKMLDNALAHFSEGFLFFYFSSVDQNSHMLWGKHDDDLLTYYRAIDDSVGEVRQRFPMADLMVMSDHGFTTFDRAVNLNRWLKDHGFSNQAYAIGLNALYLKDRNAGESLQEQLLAWRDPQNGRPVIETVVPIHPAAGNQNVAPDFIAGYGRGYRASWQTGMGDLGDSELEDNNDAWIADHCVNAADVPGVLFTSWKIGLAQPSLRQLSGALLKLFEAHTEN